MENSKQNLNTTQLPLINPISPKPKKLRNKVITIIALTIILTFIVFVVAKRYFIISQPALSPEDMASISICESELVQSFVKQKEFTPVVACRAQEIRVDDKNSYVLSIKFGEGMDCQSGCIYGYYDGVLVSNEIHDLILQPNLRQLLEFLSNKYGKTCSSFSYDNNSSPTYEEFITQMNGKYYWAYSFHNFTPIKDSTQSCVFNGTIIVTKVANGHDIAEADTSKLDVENVAN